MYKICIVGEDLRSNNLRKMYCKELWNIEEADIIIFPIPFTKDGIYINYTNLKIEDTVRKYKEKVWVSGAFKQKERDLLKKYNIKFIDLMEYEEFCINNAIATSEGAIKKAIENTDITINNSNILVLGYGRIGKILAHQLTGFGANIYAEARKEQDIALIKSMGYNEVDLKELDSILPYMDIIFNTIPCKILDEEKLKILKDNVCIIDVSSMPGCADEKYCIDNNINYELYLGIPSKTSPYTAAKYIKQSLNKILEGEDYGRKN